MISSVLSKALISTCHALDFPHPDGPTIINPWWSRWIWYSWSTFSTKDYSGSISIFLLTFTMFFLSYSYFIVGIDDPGNTPCKRFDKSGISSAISLGTIVSQTDLRSIFCSKSCNYLPSIEFTSFYCFFKFPISSLFMLPALTKTLFKARRPKS